nr:hypothetical protein [uncultured Desulfobulbus sp.]
MHHATSASTGTSKNSLSTQSDLSTSSPDHSCGCRKALQISESITLVNVALERVRHHRRTKKAKKAGKEGIPNNVAQLITQALAISRAHLMDYRDLLAQGQSSPQKVIQGNTITTDQLMKGLHPGVTIGGEKLKEPYEPIEKLKTLLTLLWSSQDKETQEFTISVNQVNWATMLMSDLIEESEQRAIGYRDHCYGLYAAIENRLKFYDLVPRESQQEGR